MQNTKRKAKENALLWEKHNTLSVNEISRIADDDAMRYAYKLAKN